LLVYKKGIENKAADAISRVHPQNNLEILAMFSSNQSGCRLLWTVIPSILKQPNCNRLDSFELKEGLIRYKGRVVIPLDLSLQTQIMQALHSSAIWGHSGFLVTYHRIKSIFLWSKMKQMIKTFVTSCQVCQQAKSVRVKYPRLLQPLPVPQFAWKVISMDFIEGLPHSLNYNCILVVVEIFFKYAHFIPLAHPFTTY
jgi:hypothetical protein